MPVAIAAAMLFAPVAVVAPSGPTEAGARAFLTAIYGHYRKGSLGVPIDHPARWFEPRLAAAIAADIAESNRTGDIGKTDADFFCDCQDFDAISAAIGPVTIAGDRATTDVTIDNGGPLTFHYTLLWTQRGWRVFDIDWGEDGGGTLRELFLGGE